MNTGLGIAVQVLLAAQQQPSLTIYNDRFAVVREVVPLDLQAGLNTVVYAAATAQLEPDSVVLRDPTGRVPLRVVEQGYRRETVSPRLLFAQCEGRVVDFIVGRNPDGSERIAKGKVIRAGSRLDRYQTNESDSPIVELDGRLYFTLPGEPVFRTLADDTILKPTLTWRVDAGGAAKLDAELAYVTGGLFWSAAYNLVAPEKGDTIDLTGWVTAENQCGRTFENAQLKVMAGDVNKLQPALDLGSGRAAGPSGPATFASVMAVTEKSFDEFHLYTLPLPVTLRHGESKQIEFVNATGVKVRTFYVYDGAAAGQRARGMPVQPHNDNPEYGTASNRRVWVMREIDNRKENGLGIALPKGRMRCYRRDDADGRVEFTGENAIDHLPRNETVRLYTGDSFELVGERKRTDRKSDGSGRTTEEAFEIRVRNRKVDAAEVRIVEHLYRFGNWELLQQSPEFTKVDADTMELRAAVPADGEVVVSYRVRYLWR